MFVVQVLLEELNFIDGCLISVFAMSVVFLILLLLTMILSLLRFVKTEEKVKSNDLSSSGQKAAAKVSQDDELERQIAMLTAACVAKAELDGDIRIVSCERLK